MHRFATGVVLLMGAFFVLEARARAADDVQIVNLGPHAFYMPKAWMQGGVILAVGSPEGIGGQASEDSH